MPFVCATAAAPIEDDLDDGVGRGLGDVREHVPRVRGEEGERAEREVALGGRRPARVRVFAEARREELLARARSVPSVGDSSAVKGAAPYAAPWQHCERTRIIVREHRRLAVVPLKW